MYKGRWKVKELKVYWFCRNCLQKGIAGISMQPAMIPDVNDITQMIQTTCHTNCRKPDLRINYEKQ